MRSMVNFDDICDNPSCLLAFYSSLTQPFSLRSRKQFPTSLCAYKDKSRISLYLLFSQPDMPLEKQNEDKTLYQPIAPASLPALDHLSQTQKDELLLKLLSVEEASKMKRRNIQAKYDKKMWATDEKFRRQKNERAAQYCKQKYQDDPEFRAKAKARALRSYYNRKQAGRGDQTSQCV